jgi:hypothetical protein
MGRYGILSNKLVQHRLITENLYKHVYNHSWIFKKSDPKKKGIKVKSEDYGRYDVTSQEENFVQYQNLR